MNITIIGCGKTGSRLANALDERGYDVAVVDSNEENFSMLSDDFSGLEVCGDVTDIDVLGNAGCESANMAFVVTGKDTVNVMVAQTLNIEFGLSEVYLRVLDPSREAVFRKFGLRTVCPTRLESDIFFNLATEDSNEIDSISIGGNSVSFAMRKPEKRELGRSVDEIANLEDKMLFAVKKKNTGELMLCSHDNITIDDGDMLIFAMI